MTWAAYYDAPTGLTLYAKPKPLVASPWVDDAIAMTESGTTGEYAITGLVDGTDYTVYQQAGGSPASSDVKDGNIYYRVDFATIAAMAAEINKIPRADAALTGGEAVDWSKTDWTDKDNVAIQFNKRP